MVSVIFRIEGMNLKKGSAGPVSVSYIFMYSLDKMQHIIFIEKEVRRSVLNMWVPEHLCFPHQVSWVSGAMHSYLCINSSELATILLRSLLDRYIVVNFVILWHSLNLSICTRCCT